jgi:hypothetical protein
MLLNKPCSKQKCFNNLFGVQRFSFVAIGVQRFSFVALGVQRFSFVALGVQRFSFVNPSKKRPKLKRWTPIGILLKFGGRFFMSGG